MKCQRCGSENVVRSGKYDKKQRWRCKSCGKWFTTIYKAKKVEWFKTKDGKDHFEIDEDVEKEEALTIIKTLCRRFNIKGVRKKGDRFVFE